METSYDKFDNNRGLEVAPDLGSASSDVEGGVPNPGGGYKGHPLDYDSVAPVKYPFPKDELKIGMTTDHPAFGR